ncbi:TonB-dependent receptor [Sphingobium fluviale]|uniref:TonB-dependent receptor n=1 Tax=Sphingobium fluviale TaxID=2506423 RepID=A0A4Q1KGC5_9SPHN|nr:TonB-dependent receptor [Sphingobium fluviale]RXR27691.1 TonB-dependent receptor [Sphingobium fluviale]
MSALSRAMLLGSSAVGVFLATHSAVAQEAASQGVDNASSYGLEEIIVTAQKRSSGLQDTPIAISAFTGETLEERGIDDVDNLQSYVPNLHIGREQDGFKISLRGIGLQGTTSISDSGVAFYADNFYIGRPAGGSAIFYDIDRIEVLRGPQGTLYGRNATGGVVNVISKLPTKDFEGQVGASYGTRNLWEVRGIVNVPLHEIAAARISAVYTKEDGYVKNVSTVPGTKDLFGTDGDLTLRGQLLVGSPDEIEVLLSATHSKLNGTGVPLSYLERRINTGAPPVRALAATIPADNPNPLITNNNTPGYLDVETTTPFVRLTKDFGGVEAVVQFGKMWQTSDLVQDFDGSSVNVGYFRKYQDSDAGSVEARLASTGDGPLKWITGVYYFTEDTYINRLVTLRGLTPGGIITLPNFDLDEWGKSTTKAAFGSLTYSFTPALRATVGGRYTKDKKSGTKLTKSNFGQPLPPDTPLAKTFDKFTWKLGLEYDVSRDIFAYASVSTGYKAGGFNISSDSSPYDPEEITAYELGIKTDLFDRRVRINLDSFYYDYKDMQLTTLGTYGPTAAPGQFTVNAGKSRIYGLELDTQFKITRELLLSATYAYTNAKFQDLCNRDPRDVPPPPTAASCAAKGLLGIDLSGKRVPYVAKHGITLGAQYTLDLGSAGELTLAANHAWHSKKWLREFAVAGIDDVKANGKTDATITYKVAETGLKVTGYVTNLENDIEKSNVYVSPGFIGTNAGTAYTKPRTFGVRADYKF